MGPAADAGRLSRLDGTERRARENRVPGVRQLNAAGLRKIEPHAAGIAAAHSPETAVVDYVAITEAMAQDVRQGGGSVLHTFDRLLVCAGPQSDIVAKLGCTSPAASTTRSMSGPGHRPWRGSTGGWGSGDLVVKAGVGGRAQAWAADGSLLDDFAVDQFGAITLLRKAPSPAAAPAMAIAGHVLEHCLQVGARH